MGATDHGIVYPEFSQTVPPNGPAQMQELAKSVDSRYGLSVATTSALGSIPTPWTGMRVWVSGESAIYVYDGAAWRVVRGLLDALKLTSSGAFTKASYPSMAFVRIRLVGGGGGGGGAAAGTGKCGSGGGAGGYAEAHIPVAELASSETITIGSGAVGGGGGSSGGDGGDSSFGTLVTAAGGKGGKARAGLQAVQGGAGGATGGSASRIVSVPGADGKPGYGNDPSVSGPILVGGAGGSNPLGVGGVERVLVGAASLNGVSGNGPGAGGSGAVNAGGGIAAGGNGSGGVALIEVFG